VNEREYNRVIDKFRNDISSNSNFSLIGPEGYTIIFTSGISESNSMILTSTIRSFIKGTNKKPHIITTSIEHISTSMLIDDIQDEIEVSIIRPSSSMNINPDDVLREIKPNTCIISITAAQEDIGIINDIKTIGTIARSRKIPLHSDVSQMFGKFPINPDDNNITAFSCSFSDIGILVIKNSYIDGYKIKPIIYGIENYNLRGGTIPISLVSEARRSYKTISKDRDNKNKKMLILMNSLIQYLKKYYNTILLKDYNEHSNDIVLVISEDVEIIPNTLMVSLPIKLKQKLINNNIFVGNVDKRILLEFNIPNTLIPGMISISLSDNNNQDHINRFIKTIYA